MWQDSSNVYAASSQNAYYGQQGQAPLQFYTPDANAFYTPSRSSLDDQVTAQGSIVPQQGMSSGYGGNIQSLGGWWTAFGTGGLEGEPPLLEGASVTIHTRLPLISTRQQSLESTLGTYATNPLQYSILYDRLTSVSWTMLTWLVQLSLCSVLVLVFSW